MNLDELIDARNRLKALPQDGDVPIVLHMVECNLAVRYGRSGVKAFNGDFVASEIKRVLAQPNGTSGGALAGSGDSLT